MKVQIKTDVSETQYAKFIEVANKSGMSAKAFLRYVVAKVGDEAETHRHGENTEYEITETLF